MTNEPKTSLTKFLPILFGFFVMGFVDIVNISTSFVKQDFQLSDTVANLIPMAVFLWFALVSIPTGAMMGRLGRKNTVLLSAVITAVGMSLPLISYSLPVVMTAFVMLGIGNTILQVSLNPLLMDVVSKERLTGSLTFGQFIKAISSFLGPLLISLSLMLFEDWKPIFGIYAVATALSFVWLLCTPMQDSGRSEKTVNSMGATFSLLKDARIVLYFSIIILIVGFEIGFMTTLPKFLLESYAIPLEQGGLACSVYYAARILGTFIGSLILSRVSPQKFLTTTVAVAVAAFVVLAVVPATWVIYTMTFVIGLAGANVFAIAFAMAMQYKRERANEISALMITGVAGGALIPPIMGLLADATNQFVSLSIPFACLVYILGVSVFNKTQKA